MSRGNLVARLFDKVVIDADVGKTACERASRRAERHT